MISRALRGGSYAVTKRLRLGTALRCWYQPERRFKYFGFRLVIRGEA